jgi:hypothetical protein
MQVISTAQHMPISRDERRRYERYQVRCECWIESDDATVHGLAADLGLGGLFLRTAVPIEQGHRVEVVIAFGSGTQLLRGQGVVTRSVRAQRGSRHGVGIELTAIYEGAEALARLARPNA